MRKIRNLIALFMLIAAPHAAFAADPKGDWIGTLEADASNKLRLAVHIKAGDDGRLQGTLDSLDQGANGIALADIASTGDSLSFSVPAVAGGYEGKWDGAQKAWVGQWTQGGGSLPLVLKAGSQPSAAPPPPPPANWAIPSDAEIAKLIEQRIAARPGAGIAIGVVGSGGPRVVTRGPAGRQPFNARTVFEIGSMTKVFTALLLAEMMEHGEVSLDDGAEKYLPAGARMPERGRKITLRDLASHGSGLPRLPDNMPMTDPDDPYADYTEARLLDFLARHQLTRDVGSQYEYSNFGMGLLGYLLARRAGTDYETLLRTRITGPLGMKDTAIALDAPKEARFAQGHDAYMRPAKPWDVAVLAGAGGIRSTVNDMLIFLEAFIGARPTPLAPAMKAMLAKRWPAMDPRSETGLGWLVVKSSAGEIVVHDGGTGGFRGNMAYDPVKKRGLVVLTNAAVEPSVNDLAIHLLVGTPLAPLQPILPAPKPVTRSAIALPSAELDHVVGRYQMGPAVVIEITRSGDQMFAQLSGQPKFPIFAEVPLTFFWKVVDAQARFVVDANGKVTGAVLVQNGQESTAKRVEP